MSEHDQLIELLKEVWNHGWSTGCADRAAHIYTRDYSEPCRDNKIEKAIAEFERRNENMERPPLDDLPGPPGGCGG